MMILLWLAYGSLAAAIFIVAACAAFELRLYWIQVSHTRLFLVLAALCILFFSGVFFTRGTVLRGGHHNEHDFSFMASVSPFTRPIQALFGDKEVSPRVFLIFWESVRRPAFGGFLALQKILWFLASLLVYAALRRTGISRMPAFLAGFFLLASHLSILNAYSFSATACHVFFVSLCVYALALLFVAVPGRPALTALWFFSAAFVLVVWGRYEFVIPMAWGFFLALKSGAWARIRQTALKDVDRSILVVLFLTVFLALILWGLIILPEKWTDEASLWLGRRENFAARVVENLRDHLGRGNWAALGIPSYGPVFILAGVFLFLACARRMPSWRSRHTFWSLFCGGWIFYASIVFYPQQLYALSHIRQHLYFLIPFPFILAVLADLSLRGFLRWLPVPFLIVYAAGNLQHVASLQSHLRTNDFEWQFLRESAENWPENCAATYAAEDDRAWVLRKYFPYREWGGQAACLLVYRSPRYQTVEFFPQGVPEVDRNPESYFGVPWAERTFQHRHYTDWQGPWSPDRIERVRSIPLRIGFFRPVSGALKSNQTLFLPNNSSYPYGNFSLWWSALRSPHPMMEPYLGPMQYCYRITLQEAVFKEKLSEEQKIPITPAVLRCYEDALSQVEGSPGLQADLLAYRAYLLEDLGREEESISDLKRAVDLAPKKWHFRAYAVKTLENQGIRLQ